MKKDIEKLKINLENLIKQAIENGDKVYIKSGDILFQKMVTLMKEQLWINQQDFT